MLGIGKEVATNLHCAADLRLDKENKRVWPDTFNNFYYMHIINTVVKIPEACYKSAIVSTKVYSGFAGH